MKVRLPVCTSQERPTLLYKNFLTTFLASEWQLKPSVPSTEDWLVTPGPQWAFYVANGLLPQYYSLDNSVCLHAIGENQIIALNSRLWLNTDFWNAGINLVTVEVKQNWPFPIQPTHPDNEVWKPNFYAFKSHPSLVRLLTACDLPLLEVTRPWKRAYHQ